MSQSPPTKRPQWSHIVFFFVSQIAAAFIFQEPQDIFNGFLRILTSSSVLITDYIVVGGLGAALLNSGLVGLISLAGVRLVRAELNGGLMAALLTISGFALFGKNLYNSIPITAGVFLYARLHKMPLKNVALTSLFATALGPLVSELSFAFDFAPWSGILAGCGAGLVVGLIITPLAECCFHIHRGFNLYNIGFTAGIIGMFATGVLRMFNLQVEPRLLVSSGNNAALSFYLLPVFAAAFFGGLYLNGWSFRGYRKLLALSGRLRTDFIEEGGYGLVLINIAVMGLASWAYVILLGGQLNGATVGGIFTVMGFSAFGKHPRNTLPIYLGAFLASLLNMHELHGTTAVIATLFGSTLAPIAGHFGVLPGIFAGFFHVSMVLNIGYLHGGMNLYNNGFSGGFIALVLVSLYTAFLPRRKKDEPCSPENTDG